MVSALASNFLYPLAVVLAAGAASTTSVVAWKLYQTVENHDRALFGESDLESHDGIVSAVNENTRMTDQHRRVLRRHDLIDDGGQVNYNRTEDS